MSASESPSALIWALVSGFAREARRKRALLMLQAYVDESVGGGIYAMAGYIAPAEKWAAFSDEWKQFLEMKPAIKYFKFGEANNLKGEFSHWREDARDEKVALLYKVIGQYVSAYIAVGVKIDDHKRIFSGLPKSISSPYHLLLFYMISGIAERQKEDLHLEGKIDFIFDEQVMEREKIWKGWDEFVRATKTPKKLIGSIPVFKDDKEIMPLQAADMLAGRMLLSWRKYFEVIAPAEIPTFESQRAIPGIVSALGEKELIHMRERMSIFSRSIVTGRFGQLAWSSLPYFEG